MRTAREERLRALHVRLSRRERVRKARLEALLAATGDRETPRVQYRRMLGREAQTLTLRVWQALVEEGFARMARD